MTNEKKQLLVLIAASIWIIVALYLASQDSFFDVGGLRNVAWQFDFGEFITRSLAWSSPAIILGGIALWWLREK